MKSRKPKPTKPAAPESDANVREFLRTVMEDRAEFAPSKPDDSHFGGNTIPHLQPLVVQLLQMTSWVTAFSKVVDAHLRTQPQDRDMLTTPILLDAVSQGWPEKRAFARKIAEYQSRLHDDEGRDVALRHLIVGWRMLSADVSPSSTGRESLTALVDDIRDLLTEWTKRASRAIKLPAEVERPIAVGLLRWRAHAESGSGEPDPFRVARAKMWTNRAAEDDEVERADETRMIVIRDTEQVRRPFNKLAGKLLPLVCAPDMRRVRDTLHAEFPHAKDAVDLLLAGIAEGQPIRMRPALLVGDAGAGKTRLCRRLGEMLGLQLDKFDAAGSADIAFAGSPKMWGNTQACFPVKVIERRRVANPLILVDEIDKAAGNSNWNGTLRDVLVAFLEPENSERHPDASLDVELNLSAVNYVLTANEELRMPGPLLDRCRIVRVGRPKFEHMPALARTIMADLAKKDPTAMSIEPLQPDEIEVAARAWKRAGMSIRNLVKIVSATLDARAATAMRH